MSTSFDVIVIGVGSMGSSACYFLAKQGYKTLGLEQFDIPHENGSHAGQSRIIRKAYFENPDYVPLLNRAYENWNTLEAETGTQIYFRTGLAYFGLPDNVIMKGVKQSASLFKIPLERLNAESTIKRFSKFKIPANFETLFEPDAGFITAEKAILLYTKQAIKRGAQIHTKEKVIEWAKDGSGITVTTGRNTYRCNKLIITAGAWAGKMIPGLSSKIKVTRQFMAWVRPRLTACPTESFRRGSSGRAKTWDDFTLNNFPCWMIADDARPGAYYGFPILPVDAFGGPIGLKLAYHFPGAATDPDQVNRLTMEEDEETLKYFLNKYLPDGFESFLSTKICLYANTPDENFIIDKLPGYEENVVVACGFSGHGFKFVSVVGEILADLATEGKTKQPIGFLNAKRFEEG